MHGVVFSAGEVNAGYARPTSASINSSGQTAQQRYAVNSNDWHDLKPCPIERGIYHGFSDPARPLLQSVPTLTPPPGSTPEPVGNIAATWEAALGKGKITFTASPSSSPSSRVASYDLRTCIGTTYRVKDESSVESIGADESPLQFLTNVGLTMPGSFRLFRIYTITEDGNEKGSPNTRLSRP